MFVFIAGSWFTIIVSPYQKPGNVFQKVLSSSESLPTAVCVCGEGKVEGFAAKLIPCPAHTQSLPCLPLVRTPMEIPELPIGALKYGFQFPCGAVLQIVGGSQNCIQIAGRIAW